MLGVYLSGCIGVLWKKRTFLGSRGMKKGDRSKFIVVLDTNILVSPLMIPTGHPAVYAKYGVL